MRWQDRRRSSNVEDRRGPGGQSGGGGGGGFRIPFGGRAGGGLGLIVILVLMLLFGGKDMLGGLFGDLFGGGSGIDTGGITSPEMKQAPRQTNTYSVPAIGEELNINDDDQLADFLSVILAETEEAWDGIFAANGRTYKPTTLVIYSDLVQSACGTGTSQTGPFYCPADQKIYIDTSFFRQLANRYGAEGDFAIAYVLAHEVGHHVQYLLGVTQQVEQQRSRLSETAMNRLTVRLELQADYLAGVWAHYALSEGLLEDGDIEEAMSATAAIGDDRLQKQAQGYVVPDSFTHGTSAQRTAWFKKGYRTGSLAEWDTFSIPYEELRALTP